MFEGSRFIKSGAVNDASGKTYAPMFRRLFSVGQPVSSARLVICGLGYVYAYLNGEKISEDLFTAPVSDYRKTLWYNEYDVTPLLRTGMNVFAAVCGNGWYNEVIPSSWDFDKSPWNDTPKLIMQLYVDGILVLETDEKFKVTVDTPYLFNQLRSGEHFDARKYDENWNTLSYDDSGWDNARYDNNAPQGVFRKCECEPIRECREYPALSVQTAANDAYVYDFGQNMSGYVRIETDLPSGTELAIRYAELMNQDGTRNINNMDRHYKASEIETDRLICNGTHFVWSPKFTYHGFQYAVISGISDINRIKVTGIFVHQDVKERADFECSDPVITKLYNCGKISSWSNMFYQMTDCPTREKLGWLNDARASAKQLLTNFETERLFAKWIVDIRDAMLDDGKMPGIAPTWGWGYEWGNGPVSDGILFEIPYQIYVQTGDPSIMKQSLSYFGKYLKYLDTRKDEDGLICFGLPDWAAPGEKSNVPVEFINAVLEYHFLHIAVLAEKLSGLNESGYSLRCKRQRALIMDRYIEDGRCIYPEQTAVAMLICYDLFDRLEPLAAQLKKLVEENGFHHNCGMVGLRHLYYALTKSDLCDYAVKILTNPSYPSQAYWLGLGANTLWELWEPVMSRNHHMYSDFMGWVIDALLGIRAEETHPGYSEVVLDPCFPQGISYAKGYVNTVSGQIEVKWERDKGGIILSVSVPENIPAYFRGEKLLSGRNRIEIL